MTVPPGPAAAVAHHQERLDGLLDAVMAVSADLELSAVLERIVTTASRLVDASYGALGVIDPDGRLEQFVTTGLTAEQAAAIGPLPKGHGVLGTLIERPEPLRLADLGKHPDSYGVPSGHPPMKTFLGVPIRLRDRVFGNLYLTDKRDGAEFGPEDEAVVVALAAAASIAIGNARSYERSRRRQAWLEAAAAASADFLRPGADPQEATLAALSAARRVESADAACLLVDDGAGLRVVAGSHSGRWARAGAELQVPHADVLAGIDVVRAVDPGSLGWSAESAALVPARLGTRLAAVLVLGWIDGVHLGDTPDALSSRQFLEQLVLAREVAAAQEVRARLAVLGDRERIAADLHDHVIQRLFAVGLSLQAVGARVPGTEVADRLETSIDDIDDTIRDLRRAIFELRDRVVARDARAALLDVARSASQALGFAPTVVVEGDLESLPGEVGEQLLAVTREALSNAAKHARASNVGVRVHVGPDTVRLQVHDDGGGLPERPGPHRGGLHSMTARAQALGGSCDVHSSVGSGTRVTWQVPLGPGRGTFDPSGATGT